MSYWNGRTAVVTGAASGIGLALSEAMLSSGATVWLTDINEAGVREAAERLGTSARWRALDVCDAAAVQDLITQVADETGIDFLFNNAGIGVGGESHLLKVNHYNQIIDINIRGVTNGIAAAYPLMVQQGRGHIVNTASAAGLVPAPLLTPYSMTKHAVVGLTKSLRLEAANYGVRVSALCPTAIETPILDSEAPADLANEWQPDVRRFLTKLGGPPYPVEKFAEQALRALERNREIIVIPASGRVASFLYRCSRAWWQSASIGRWLRNWTRGHHQALFRLQMVSGSCHSSQFPSGKIHERETDYGSTQKRPSRLVILKGMAISDCVDSERSSVL